MAISMDFYRIKKTYHGSLRHMKSLSCCAMCCSCRRQRLFIRAGGSACSPLLANFISTAAKRKKTHPQPTLQIYVSS